LVGNKKDLDAEREVTFLEASRFAQENGWCMLRIDIIVPVQNYFVLSVVNIVV